MPEIYLKTHKFDKPKLTFYKCPYCSTMLGVLNLFGCRFECPRCDSLLSIRCDDEVRLIAPGSFVVSGLSHSSFYSAMELLGMAEKDSIIIDSMSKIEFSKLVFAWHYFMDKGELHSMSVETYKKVTFILKEQQSQELEIIVCPLAGIKDAVEEVFQIFLSAKRSPSLKIKRIAMISHCDIDDLTNIDHSKSNIYVENWRAGSSRFWESKILLRKNSSKMLDTFENYLLENAQ